ncbi:MAG: transposase, partial [Brevinematales bacterium]|nr:transposase [Brevinematales bacterium]
MNLQCRLLGLNRSTVYYRPVREYSTDLTLKGLIDREYTRHPFLGYRKMTDFLQKQGYKINGKRVRRLMREMGIQAVYPKPRLSIPDKQHKKFPYLLKGMEITRVNQVW